MPRPERERLSVAALRDYHFETETIDTQSRQSFARTRRGDRRRGRAEQIEPDALGRLPGEPLGPDGDRLPQQE
jgi:hypothetical protein